MKKSEKIQLTILWAVLTALTLISVTVIIYNLVHLIANSIIIWWFISPNIFSFLLLSLIAFVYIYPFILQIKCVISIAKNKFVEWYCGQKLKTVFVFTIIKLILLLFILLGSLDELSYSFVVFILPLICYYALLAIVCKLLKMDRFYQ